MEDCELQPGGRHDSIEEISPCWSALWMCYFRGKYQNTAAMVDHVHQSTKLPSNVLATCRSVTGIVGQTNPWVVLVYAILWLTRCLQARDGVWDYWSRILSSWILSKLPNGYFSWFMKLNLSWSINISVLLLLNIFEVRFNFTLCLSQISCMMKA